ncbi:UbiA family prenyltransferase [Streptomyces sp. NBC_01260]|uniref:UbiA family prenyltransferase n=1 Tax=unclassified Streptomyces TaxID=2593676 RepID=UPI000F4937D9|nr:MULTISPECIES: UbiA family prenyltransferase [unclassified Streptomyces]MCX4774588.1 UbiA family prenyltransferase [Streptomyces sp. NBC_01285]ROQ72883.1 4-hydroxybenzoate polyprenyltransferase [Streptomyces sp. CEV 2-1]RPK35234.1 prenyltransferase [Streptomyces sp. ADI92-24]
MGTPDPSRVYATTAWPLRRTAALARSCHPGPVVAVSALAGALGVGVGLDGARCALLVAAVLSGQLSVGWCNDAFDARRDASAGRRGKPVADGSVSRPAVWTAAFAAALLCVPLSLACGLLAGTVHLAAVAAAWAYNLRLKATALSWLPYVIGFATLPAVAALTLPGSPGPAWWAVTAGALLGLAAHLGDVLPDIEDDLRNGVYGLPHRLGVTGTALLLPVPLVAASAVLALGPAGPPGWWGAVTLAVAAPTALAGLVLGRYWRKAALAAAVVVAAADVALLLVRGAAPL